MTETRRRRVSAPFWLAAAAAVLVSAAVPEARSTRAAASARSGWTPAPRPERLLPNSANDWEPALAVGPGGSVYVTAGRRTGSQATNDFAQRLLIWRSPDDGETFEGPFPVSPEGEVAADQRVAVDDNGIVYVSYIAVKQEEDRYLSFLRLARSADRGRTFRVETVTDQRVGDKPELAVSPDGKNLHLVYESSPGPRLISSRDGGKTWGEARVVEQANGRHFWPTGLSLGPAGELWFAVPSVPNEELQKGGPTVTTLHVFRSSDGNTWRRSAFGTSPWMKGGCAHDFACRVKTNYIGVAADAKGRAYVAFTEGEASRKPYRLFFQSSDNAGADWTPRRELSAAARSASKDRADYDLAHVAAAGDGRVCILWVDDRLGSANVWARCSSDAGGSWGAETLLSNRHDGAPYKSAQGFGRFYGHYGGVAIAPTGRLHAAWPEGPRDAETGAIWVNSMDVGTQGGTR